jgi:hypothetical protein
VYLAQGVKLTGHLQDFEEQDQEYAEPRPALPPDETGG